MFRFISVTMIGLAIAGILLATPSTSQAQVGVGVRVGPVGVNVGPTYPVVVPYPVYVAPPVQVVQPAVPVVQPVPEVAPYPVAPRVVIRTGVWFPHRHFYHRHHY